MNTIDHIVQNEEPKDVILFLTRGASISHPQLDRLYERNKWVFLGNCLGLIDLIKKMRSDGLIEQKGGGYSKGPKWTPPQFLLEKKYKLNQP
ncbi:hypothetical protein [Pseudomonas sp. NPDC012596]|uniref:hypothetical protein n=1 Tax=Pseudomonas sp. NPDC012596 TaxID=3364419 RepID=UPI0036C2DB84